MSWREDSQCNHSGDLSSGVLDERSSTRFGAKRNKNLVYRWEARTGKFADDLKGEMNIVYSSLEVVLGNVQWREMVSSPIYQRNVIAGTVDEAHCITHWYV